MAIRPADGVERLDVGPDAVVQRRPARRVRSGTLARTLPEALRPGGRVELRLPANAPWQTMARIRSALESAGFEDTISGIMQHPGRSAGVPYRAGALWLVGERNLEPVPGLLGRLGYWAGVAGVAVAVGLFLILEGGDLGSSPNPVGAAGIVVAGIAIAGLAVQLTAQPFRSELVAAFASPQGDVVDNDTPVTGGWKVELRAAEVRTVLPAARMGGERYVTRAYEGPGASDALGEIAGKLAAAASA